MLPPSDAMMRNVVVRGNPSANVVKYRCITGAT